jgi:hypothetical protein
MRGDFSRWTFDKRKHYNAVLRQQGRVDVDADWNEHVQIGKHLDRTQSRDVIGPCGTPLDEPGFEIKPVGPSFTIGRGKYYVSGILCENETKGAVSYREQPDLRDARTPAQIICEAGNTYTFGIVYLDVWERLVTAVEDSQIREVALGGPDTATRARTVWQVRVSRSRATRVAPAWGQNGMH